MRPVLIVLAGACASVATSLMVWAAVSLNEAPYYELLNASLIRTTAGEQVVNLAVSAAFESSRPHSENPEEGLANCEYHEEVDAWFARPNLFGASEERASRIVRAQRDRYGRQMQVEVLRGADMPTMVFVKHEDPECTLRILNQLGLLLADAGVQQR